MVIMYTIPIRGGGAVLASQLYNCTRTASKSDSGIGSWGSALRNASHVHSILEVELRIQARCARSYIRSSRSIGWCSELENNLRFGFKDGALVESLPDSAVRQSKPTFHRFCSTMRNR